MTGPEHYLKAQQLQAEADKWANADHGWMAQMPTEERISRRMADLADAQVHATLALTAAIAGGSGMPEPEFELWIETTDVKRAEAAPSEELAEIDRLRARNAQLEADSDRLNALEAAGVDNWDGYDEAVSSRG